MAPLHHPLVPNASNAPTSIRKIHIQNLVDLLHACLLSGDLVRARRAWSILIRCLEVDWKARWRWGLALHSAATPPGAPGVRPGTNGYDDGQTATQVSQWLRTVRMTVNPEEKPAVLHALTLHLIQHAQYREALEELETYLTSYPYLLSGPLHTYAGMLAFYLAQPESLRRPATVTAEDIAEKPRGVERGSRASSATGSTVSKIEPITGLGGFRVDTLHDPPNPTLLRQARTWFVKALEIEPGDTVAEHFIHLIDTGFTREDLSELDDEWERDSIDVPPVPQLPSGAVRPGGGRAGHDIDLDEEAHELEDGMDDEDDYWG